MERLANNRTVNGAAGATESELVQVNDDRVQ